jgi:hypothetical protein
VLASSMAISARLAITSNICWLMAISGARARIKVLARSPAPQTTEVPGHARPKLFAAQRVMTFERLSEEE